MIRSDAADESTLAQAAHLLEELDADSVDGVSRVLNAPPTSIPPDVLRHLNRWHAHGAAALLEDALARVPSDLSALVDAHLLSIEQLGDLHRALDVASMADLAVALETSALPEVLRGPAWPQEPDDRDAWRTATAAALPDLRARRRRLPFGRAAAAVEPLLEQIRSLPGVDWTHETGSLRRGEDTVGDLELIVASTHPGRVSHEVADLSGVVRCLHRSDRRVWLQLADVQVSVHLSALEQAGTLAAQLTGSDAHVAALRARAAERGLRLEPGRLMDHRGTLRPAATEASLYAALGLPFIPPEIRAGHEELEAARHGTLPHLVSRQDIRGDLHMHSNWSDGRDPIDAMARACRDLGYAYMAITDHSPRSAASRNLSADDVGRQADEIAGVRERYPDLTIFHGCEVDIMPDGRLDFPDEILERFDLILASLHDGAGQGPAQLFRRYAGAMRHPLVTLITHPTNRMVPHKPGYALDYDGLFALAAETGTIVEIDGAPSHLDLPGHLARRAVAVGASLSIDSDGHRADRLGRQMEHGTVMARRGWIEPHHVVNCLPLDALRARLLIKRGA